MRELSSIPKRTTILVVWFFVLVAFAAAQGPVVAPSDTAKHEEPVVSLSGTGRAEGQTANRQGTLQETPARYARLNINPTLTIYDVPFTLHLLLSSEQTSDRQHINSFHTGFGVDTRRLWNFLQLRVKDLLKSPEQQERREVLRVIDTLTARLNDSTRAVQLAQLRSMEDYGDTTGSVIAPIITRLRQTARETEAIKARRDSIEKDGGEKLAETRTLERMVERKRPDSAADRQQVTDALGDAGFLTKIERFFYDFSRFGVGVNYPNYTPLTIDGAPVTGVDLEYAPRGGKLYVATAIGKSQARVQTPDTVLAYQRIIYAGRVGYGRRRESHFHITGMYAADDPGSVPIEFRSFLTPQANYILGIETKIPVVPDYFNLDAEVTGSVLTTDTRSPGIEQNDIPQFATDIVTPLISTHTDYSMIFGSTLRIEDWGTQIRGSFRRLGAGFKTLGAPTLRTDYQRVELRAEQRIVHNRVALTGFYRSEFDNLLRWKRARTTTLSYGVTMALSFPDYPILALSYTPLQQTNDQPVDSLRINNRISLIAISSSYSIRIKDIFTSIGASFSSQGTRTLQRDYNFGANAISVSDAVVFLIPLTLSAAYTYTWPVNLLSESIGRRSAIDFNGSYTLNGNWTNTLGVTYSNEIDRNNRTGFYLRSSFPVASYGTMDIRMEKTLFHDKLSSTSSYDEFILRAGLLSQW